VVLGARLRPKAGFTKTVASTAPVGAARLGGSEGRYEEWKKVGKGIRYLT